MVTLYSDAELWRSMSKATQAFARTNFSFERGRVLMRRVLGTVDLSVGNDDQALVVNRARPAP